MSANNKKLLITYTKSVIGYSQKHRGTIRSLGLRHLGDVVEHDDSPVLRGMLNKVRHLVAVEEKKA